MRDEIPPHASALRKGRFSQNAGLYLITKCLLPGESVEDAQRTDLCVSFQHARAQGWLLLHAFVVMPDHWHALFSLGEELELGRTIHEINRHASFPSRQAGGRISWQPGYHDRKIRPDDSVVEIVQYIESNPVREEWVAHRSEWLWSSAHADYADHLDRSFLGPERWADAD